MGERSREVGYIVRGGISWVWDLAADAYVPVVRAGTGPTDLGTLELAKVGEDLGSLDPEDLTRAEAEARYGGEVRGAQYMKPRRHRRAGG